VRLANDTKIDTHKALLAANAVIKFGTTSPGGAKWHGITVLADPDGYTVTLTDDDVELRLLFHNKFQLTARNRFARGAFIEKLEKVLVAARNQSST